MKRLKLIPVLLVMMLMVAAVGCTTMAGTEDDYYDGQQVYGVGSSIYYDSPLIGEYYAPYGYAPYRYYGRSYHAPYYRRNTEHYNRGNHNSNNVQPQPQPRMSIPQGRSRDEARRKVLGK